jgi:excisionase family DNA binding protein
LQISDFFYTQIQVAELLSVDRTTIWRWAKEGKIDIQRIGREVLIPKWEVELLRLNKQKRRK